MSDPRTSLTISNDEAEAIRLIEIFLKQADKNSDWFSVLCAIKKISLKPFGSSSQEFLNHPALIGYVNNPEVIKFFNSYNVISNVDNQINMRDSHISYRLSILWIRIQEYLAAKDDNSKMEKLEFIHQAIQENIREMTGDKRKCGTALLPFQIADNQFIQKLYQTNDLALINTFEKLMPTARPEVFPLDATPQIVAERAAATKEVLKKY